MQAVRTELPKSEGFAMTASGMQRMLVTDEAAWLEKKKGYVTSTEAAALFGVQANYVPTAFELWHIKRGILEPRFVDSKFTQFGKLIEEPVCKMVNIDHPEWKISSFPFFVYNDADRIGSSYDREVLIEGRPWLLEIKSISYEQYKKDFIEHDVDDIEASAQYEVQMQVELECAEEYEGCVMAVFILDTRTLKYIFRKRDKQMGSTIREAVREFWAMDEAPAIDFAKDKSVLAKILPACDPTKELDATKDERITLLAAAYKNSKDIEKQEKENAEKIYAELMSLLGTAKYAWTNSHKITVSDIKAREGTPGLVGKCEAHKRLTITATEKKDKK